MSLSESEQILADERSAQKQYDEFLKERAHTPVVIAMPRNAIMTNDRIPKTNYPESGQLFGRVRLSKGSETIDGAEDFYIGTSHGTANGVEVFSWRAPVACAFFRGRDHHDLCDAVVGVRTLGHEANTVTHFDDEATSLDAPSPLFRRGVFMVPKPVVRAPVAPVDSATVTVPAAPAVDPSAGAAASPAAGEASRPSQPPSMGHQETAFAGLRAAPILLKKLAAPKHTDLSPVLSTLQPDQYDAITRPAMDSVIFQGHPGTGKTIIAVHRLAFLTNPDARERMSDGLVMLIGPTREYSQHVTPAVNSLVGEADDNVLVSSLPALLDELSGLRDHPREDTRSDDQTVVGDEIVSYLSATFTDVKRKGLLTGLDRETAVAVLYERLRTDPAFLGGTAIDASWYHFLRALPSFEEARSSPNLRALLAYLGMRFRKPVWFADLAHVIVDEGQDVHPLEWEILGRLGPSQGWTILGDLNQRRADSTFRSWKRVASILAIEEDGKAPVEFLERGYRSTGPIMAFANRLLPRTERQLSSIQAHGVEPKKVRAQQRDKLASAAVDEAIALLSRLSGGSVAIIAATTSPIAVPLRRAGWSAQTEGGQVWNGPDGTVRLLSHDQARGLEFDGVVVVEPADFPQTEGRLGSLYTSLTRANKELVVVNHRALPEQLRN